MGVVRRSSASVGTMSCGLAEKLDKVLTDMVCFIEHNETVMKKSEEKQNAE